MFLMLLSAAQDAEDPSVKSRFVFTSQIVIHNMKSFGGDIDIVIN